MLLRGHQRCNSNSTLGQKRHQIRYIYRLIRWTVASYKRLVFFTHLAYQVLEGGTIVSPDGGMASQIEVEYCKTANVNYGVRPTPATDLDAGGRPYHFTMK